MRLINYSRGAGGGGERRSGGGQEARAALGKLWDRSGAELPEPRASVSPSGAPGSGGRARVGVSGHSSSSGGCADKSQVG